jgi:4-amino-4-deoxy-L-arabinose transferase-like glycosyltransferase
MARIDLRVAAAIALVSAAFLCPGLSRYGIVNADEGIYHGIAERMAATGDLLRLDFRGEPRVYDTFLNAPLHYWARAALIAGFGSDGFSMRALSAVFGALAVAVTYLLGCRLVGARAALLAAAVQLTTFQFVWLHGARTGELDAIATCLVAAACLAFLRAVQDGRSFVPHHLLLIALLLTKLPLAALPVIAELAWLALHPGDRRHLRRYVAAGLPLLPVALAWHATQALLLRDQVMDVIATMLGQATGGSAPGTGPADSPDLGVLGNLRFDAGTLLYGALPWSAAWPFAIAAALFGGAGAAGRRTALLHAAVVIGFFALVSKHYPWYVMPAYPFLAIATGAWLDDLLRGDAKVSAAGLGAVIAACAWLGAGVVSTNPFATSALVFPMEVAPRSWLGIGAAAAIAGIGAVWAIAWLAAARRLPAGARRALSGAAAAGLLAFAAVRVAAPLAHIDHQSDLTRIHAEIARALAEGRPLDYPIPLGRPPLQQTRFLFGEDFEIVIREAPDGSDVALYRKGDPAVLDRSIGRGGLEWRLARQGARSVRNE